MEIKGIMLYSQSCMRMYTPDYMTFEDMRTNYLSKQCYLYITLNNKSRRIIDLTRLFNDETTLLSTNVNTWTQVISVLDNVDIEEYRCDDIPIPTYIFAGSASKELSAIKHELHLIGENELVIVSAETNSNVHTGFGNLSKPQYNNIYATRKINTDMLFTVDSNKLNLINTLPVCNGFVCYPTVVNNTLYASQGATLSRNSKDVHNGWLLIDFTNAGTLECVKLSECTGTLSSLTLPDNKSMKDKFVMLVIDGRLYLPGEFIRLSTKAISFNTNLIQPIYTLDKKLCKFEQIWNTPNILQDNINWLTCDNSFLIMIDNPSMMVAYHESIYKITNELYKFSEYAGGLLMDMSTRSLVDYTRVNYNNKHFISDFGSSDAEIVTRQLNGNTTSRKKEDLPFDAYTVVTVPKRNELMQVVAHSDNNLMSAHGMMYSSRTALQGIVNHSIEHKPILIDFMFKAKDE